MERRRSICSTSPVEFNETRRGRGRREEGGGRRVEDGGWIGRRAGERKLTGEFKAASRWRGRRGEATLLIHQSNKDFPPTANVNHGNLFNLMPAKREGILNLDLLSELSRSPIK
jgi:hypothetical protein